MSGDPIELDLAERMAADALAVGQVVTMLLSHLANHQSHPASFLARELDQSVSVMRRTRFAGLSPAHNEAILSLAEDRLSVIFATAGARWRERPNEPDTAPPVIDPEGVA